MNRHLENQSYLGPLFVDTNNAGAVAEASERDHGEFMVYGGDRPDGPKHANPTKHQQGIQARVIAHLKQYGGIDALTVQKLGTTDARKIFSRLRDKGFLYPAEDPNGHEERANASGQGTYRWHRWTGKQ